MTEKKTVQNQPTPLDKPLRRGEGVCREAATNVFDRLINWLPLREVAEQAAAILIAKMDTADFFTEKYALTEKQKDFIKSNIKQILFDAGNQVVAKKTDWEKDVKDETCKVVIEEMVKIPEQVMAEIGAEVNRGAVLAMCAVAANAKSDKYDDITMRKSKDTGDITIPTRGVFVSTNCIEKLKEEINFANLESVKTEIE